MGPATDEFLAEMLPKHHAAELSFRNGDAGATARAVVAS
jgi:hypothetical protein